MGRIGKLTGVAGVGAAIALTMAWVWPAQAGGGSGALPTQFVPMTPCRLVDTRPAPDTIGARDTPLPPNADIEFQVRGANGQCVIPPEATAISTNVTAVAPSANSYLTVYPGDAPRPLASNLNFRAGSFPVPNAVTVRLSITGSIKVYNKAGNVNVIVDIVGYYIEASSTSTSRLTPRQLATLQWNVDPGREQQIPLSQPTGIAFDGSYIWVASQKDNTVSKIARDTGDVIASVAVGKQPQGMAFDGSSIWVANRGSNTVSKINPETNAVTATIAVGDKPVGLIFDGTFLWSVEFAAGGVSKISVLADQVVGSVHLPAGAMGAAFDGAHLWVASSGSDVVSKIDPSSALVVDTVNVGMRPSGVAFDGRYVWIANAGSGTVSRLLPDSNVVAGEVPVGQGASAIAYDGTSLWVLNSDDNTMSRVNPLTLQETNLVITGLLPGVGLVYDGVDLWFSVTNSDTLSKVIAF